MYQVVQENWHGQSVKNKRKGDKIRDFAPKRPVDLRPVRTKPVRRVPTRPGAAQRVLQGPVPSAAVLRARARARLLRGRGELEKVFEEEQLARGAGEEAQLRGVLPTALPAGVSTTLPASLSAPVPTTLPAPVSPAARAVPAPVSRALPSAVPAALPPTLHQAERSTQDKVLYKVSKTFLYFCM